MMTRKKVPMYATTASVHNALLLGFNILFLVLYSFEWEYLLSNYTHFFVYFPR